MLDGDTPLLIDFGTAKIIQAGQTISNLIAAKYICAPERAKGESSSPTNIHPLGIALSLLNGDRELNVRSQFLIRDRVSICESFRG
jgi:hypothetical protein